MIGETAPRGLYSDHLWRDLQVHVENSQEQADLPNCVSVARCLPATTLLASRNPRHVHGLMLGTPNDQIREAQTPMEDGTRVCMFFSYELQGTSSMLCTACETSSPTQLTGS